jgi:hypothetical protein
MLIPNSAFLVDYSIALSNGMIKISANNSLSANAEREEAVSQSSSAFLNEDIGKF